ncbi:MAG: dienelactone hydrolase family protein [Oscillospiraceae bacterium]|nr:dienelactone hydrolase family protein [Oscillospiraceae bacterium]
MKRLIYLLAVFALICGCSNQISMEDPTETTTQQAFIETSAATTSAVPETTESKISTTIASTDPVVMETVAQQISLGISCGTYFDRFRSNQSSDYLDYYLYVPENAVCDMPLVVFLHGDGSVNDPESLKDRGVIASARTIYGENYPFISISPCTRVRSWITDSIPDTLMELIEYTVNSYQIDPEKIIIMGHSRGAKGVWNMISIYGDYFSAAVPVSCGAASELNDENCAKVPVKAFVGDADDSEEIYMDYMEEIVSDINDAGGNAELVVLEGYTHGKTMSGACTEELLEWILEQ